MAVKGAIFKQEIFNRLREIYPDSFVDGKDLRINGTEDGVNVQIKVSLTAAKTPVAANAQETEKKDSLLLSGADSGSPSLEPTDEEKQRLKTLIDKFNLS